MAIITEVFKINGRAFTKTFSNEYRYVVRNGISYIEAIDPSEFNRTYVEGEPIDILNEDYERVGQILIGITDFEEDVDMETRQEYAQIGRMFLGVDENDSN